MFLIIIAALVALTDAYPFFAGTCDGGNPVLQSPHPYGGLLGNGNLLFKINGEEVPPDTVFDLSVGVHRLELSGRTFNGFLFRLSSSSGINTRDKLIYSEDDARDQGSCASNVAGISHFSAEPKTSITMTFDGSKTGDYTLDLTAGIGHIFSPPDGKWLYNQYNLRVLPPPTPSPSLSSWPSKPPSLKPTLSPTLSTSPSSTPSLQPSEVPSFSTEPSFKPTNIDTNSPSESPTDVLSMKPTTTTTSSPSTSSTESPSVELSHTPSLINHFMSVPSSSPSASNSSRSFNDCVVTFAVCLLLAAPFLAA